MLVMSETDEEEKEKRRDARVSCSGAAEPVMKSSCDWSRYCFQTVDCSSTTFTRSECFTVFCCMAFMAITSVAIVARTFSDSIVCGASSSCSRYASNVGPAYAAMRSTHTSILYCTRKHL